jgi:transitional endoplasmic reticulum ATPase
VLLLEDDLRTSHTVPPELWPELRQVGVVRRVLNERLLVESDGRMSLVPCGEVSCSVGNTVEFGAAAGVTSVISETPIRYRDDNIEIDSVVERFRLRDQTTTNFEDLGGLGSIVSRARELIEVQLQRPELLASINARRVKGILFTGPPGTGKTTLAKAIASNADAAFFMISGPEIFSKWYGESEEILRALFRAAEGEDSAIIFFDEIDSVAARRDEDAHEASKRVVAQLLTLMDGFGASRTVVVAATNRPEDIDPALRRPGRFDWEIEFPMPELAARREILERSIAKLATRGTLPLQVLAEGTDGWSPADLTAIWSEAAMFAAADNRGYISTEDALVGLERVSAMRNSRGMAAKSA